MSCHKNRVTVHIITLWCKRVMSLITMRFLMEIWFILRAIKPRFNGYNHGNLLNSTLVVILYEIYETRRRLVPFHIKTESKALQDAFHNCNFDLVMMTFWVRLKKTRKQTQSRLRFDHEKLGYPGVAGT